jgi:hypothetical protein
LDSGESGTFPKVRRKGTKFKCDIRYFRTTGFSQGYLEGIWRHYFAIGSEINGLGGHF